MPRLSKVLEDIGMTSICYSVLSLLLKSLESEISRRADIRPLCQTYCNAAAVEKTGYLSRAEMTRCFHFVRLLEVCLIVECKIKG